MFYKDKREHVVSVTIPSMSRLIYFFYQVCIFKDDSYMYPNTTCLECHVCNKPLLTSAVKTISTKAIITRTVIRSYCIGAVCIGMTIVDTPFTFVNI